MRYKGSFKPYLENISVIQKGLIYSYIRLPGQVPIPNLSGLKPRDFEQYCTKIVEI